ncbi:MULTISPECIES: hypothetical protein [Micrococcus]|uniref:Polysaccharide biosynthesis protein n=1 Tax=Micrococcus lylae TaxID=1273 RepID=A0ABY2K220_9MICC|nr:MULTISPECIES: hypothetical protein [Micrococcus]TFI01208.1 hypothetical protein E4A49_01775 [Micrococcus lylae]
MSISAMVAVPILLGVAGQAVWLSIALGQALGELARVVVIWGWNSVGLARASALEDGARPGFYLDSIPPRLLLCLPAAGAIALATALIPTASPIDFALMASAGMVNGLNGAWIYISAHDPRGLLRYDALPRTIVPLFGVAALALHPEAWLYSTAVLTSNVVAAVIPVVVMRRRLARAGVAYAHPTFTQALTELRAGFSAFVIGLVLVARMSLPVLAAGIASEGIGVVVALADKFIRWGNRALTPFLQFMQTSIPRGTSPLAMRIRRGVLRTIVLSVVTTIGSAIVTWSLSPVISAGEITLSPVESTAVGVVLGAIAFNSITGNSSLVLLGRTRSVAAGGTAALITLACAAYPLTALLGAAGLLLAYAAAEVCITVYLCVLLVVEMRALKRRNLSSALATAAPSPTDGT